jgi:hypothetical protein
MFAETAKSTRVSDTLMWLRCFYMLLGSHIIQNSPLPNRLAERRHLAVVLRWLRILLFPGWINAIHAISSYYF